MHVERLNSIQHYWQSGRRTREQDDSVVKELIQEVTRKPKEYRTLRNVLTALEAEAKETPLLDFLRWYFGYIGDTVAVGRLPWLASVLSQPAR